LFKFVFQTVKVLCYWSLSSTAQILPVTTHKGQGHRS